MSYYLIDWSYDMRMVKFDFEKHIEFLLDAFEESAGIDFPDLKRSAESRNIDCEKIKELDLSENDIKILKYNDDNTGFIWINYRYNKIERIKYCNLNYLYIHPYYRGKGYGKYLMDIFEQEAKKNEAHILCLEATVSNKSAVRLYEKVGFVTKRFIMRKEID